MLRRCSLTFLLTIVLVACSEFSVPTPTPEPASNLRPPGTPDVVVMAFAGRCGAGLFDCVAPAGNEAYLDRSPNTVQSVATAFRSEGYTVDTRSYRAHLDSSYSLGDGYLQAQANLSTIQQTMIANFDNPTRLVLIAHSHGTQFASLLAMDNPHIIFDYSIYLDGVCLMWERDHLDSGAFLNRYGTEANYPFPLNVLGEACNSFPVTGLGLEDIKDVVPENVVYGLEVRSGGFWNNGFLIKDHDVNTREDGRKGNNVGLATITENEGHSEVAQSYSRAMTWVVEMIRLNNLPQNSLGTQSASSLQRRPAPEGFSY